MENGSNKQRNEILGSAEMTEPTARVPDGSLRSPNFASNQSAFLSLPTVVEADGRYDAQVKARIGEAIRDIRLRSTFRVQYSQM
jgi:hypothetical protein